MLGCELPKFLHVNFLGAVYADHAKSLLSLFQYYPEWCRHKGLTLSQLNSLASFTDHITPFWQEGEGTIHKNPICLWDGSRVIFKLTLCLVTVVEDAFVERAGGPLNKIPNSGLEITLRA